jgi:hypothetical protein
VTTDAGRLAAYADLVAAVLDLRPATTREAFDKAIVDGLSSGTITDDLAKQLRWLQRQNERAMVEHAESVLPPALVALDRSAADALSPVSSVLQTASPEPSAGTEAATDPVIDPVTSDLDDLPDDEPGAVVNLQARGTAPHCSFPQQRRGHRCAPFTLAARRPRTLTPPCP